MKIGILASGTGSNAQAIIERIASGALTASIGVIISNRPNAQVLERAKKAGLPARLIERSQHPNRLAYDAALVSALQEHDCQLIVLAGYMLVLSKVFLDAFPGKVVNIHPSLLPSFPGTAGALNAMTYGVKVTGCSVHFVDEDIDTGPLIIQAAVPLRAGEDLDSLKQRIHRAEHRIYPQALQWFVEGRLSVAGRQVSLALGSRPLAKTEPDLLISPPLEEGF